MKKSIVYIFILFLTINLISNVIAEDYPVNVNVPIVGNINTESGLPSSFEKFRAISENLSDEEKTKQYLYQEWTKLFAKNDKIAAVFFYTDIFFSTLDPIWEFVFQLKFSWTWEFILCLVLFITLIITIFMPVQEIFNVNPILTFGISIIIACLAGKGGGIKLVADQLAFAVKNIWLAILCLLITIIIMIIYSYILQKIGKDIRKQAETEELERAKKAIKAHGEISEKALKGFSSNNKD